MISKKLLTLCVVYRGDKILLGMKKRGFGQGRWNGFGGKVHDGETIEVTAHRELLEEVGLTTNNLNQVGVLNFSWVGKEEILEVTVFSVTDFSGIPTEGEEMKPQWFLIKDIPYDQMWKDDKYWLPLLLFGKKFEGQFLFDNNDQIVEYKLTS